MLFKTYHKSHLKFIDNMHRTTQPRNPKTNLKQKIKNKNFKNRRQYAQNYTTQKPQN
jgi:hypothetical protein